MYRIDYMATLKLVLSFCAGFSTHGGPITLLCGEAASGSSCLMNGRLNWKTLVARGFKFTVKIWPGGGGLDRHSVVPILFFPPMHS